MVHKTLLRGTFAYFNNQQQPKKVCLQDMQETLNSSGKSRVTGIKWLNASRECNEYKIELKLSSKNVCGVNNLLIKY